MAAPTRSPSVPCWSRTPTAGCSSAAGPADPTGAGGYRPGARSTTTRPSGPPAYERELLEETGLTVEVGDVGEAGAWPFEWQGCSYLIIYSRATVTGGQLRPDGDVDAVRFYCVAELPHLLLGGTARAALTWNAWLPEPFGLGRG